MNNNNTDDKLTAEQKLAINDYVKGLVIKSLKLLGFANLLAILGAIAYIYYIIPKQVVETMQPTIKKTAIEELNKQTPQIDRTIDKLYDVVTEIVQSSGETEAQFKSIASKIKVIKASNRQIKKEQAALTKEQEKLTDEINKAHKNLEANKKTIEDIIDPKTKKTLEIIKIVQDENELDEIVAEVKNYNKKIAEHDVRIETLEKIEQWQSVELKNGWKKFGDGYDDPKYFKDNFKVVHLSGVVKDGNKKTIFKLPMGCRPENKKTYIVCSGGSGKSRIVIEPDGDVKVAEGGYEKLSLDGVTFRAEH